MSSDKKLWTRSETLQLIEKYKQRRELWDTKCIHYRDKFKKKCALQSLASEFNTIVSEVCRKLHNLKTQFLQEVKKERKRKSGLNSNELYESKWAYFEVMKFTMNQDTPAATDDSMDSTSIDMGGQSAPEEEPAYTSPPLPKRTKKVIKQNDDAPLGSGVVVTPKTSEKPDEYQIFGDYVANELRNMHFPKYKGQLKRKIQRLIIEYTEIDDNVYLKGEEPASSNELRQHFKPDPFYEVEVNEPYCEPISQ